MRIVWSLPTRGERLTSTRGDLVRARYLIEALRSDGHEVIVVDNTGQVHGLAVAAYRTRIRAWLPRGAALVLRDIGRALQGCVHGVHVARTAGRAHADLIIETQVAYTISGAVATRLTGIPFVLDDCSSSFEEREFGVGLPTLARATLALQARSARSVVAVSPALASMLAGEGLPPQKLVCVPNGVDVDAFRRTARHRLAATEGDLCVAVFAGSFQPWHRVELLIDAVARLPAACRLHVVLAGEGPGLDAALRAAAARGVQDQVTTVGAVPAAEMPPLLAGCDVGVLPHSNTYGDPMKLREYAAAGLAVVAPDLSPVREVVEPGVTGLLFRPADVQGLAHALARLASNTALRRQLGDEGRRRALCGGSWTQRGRALIASMGHLSLPPCAPALQSCGPRGRQRPRGGRRVGHHVPDY